MSDGLCPHLEIQFEDQSDWIASITCLNPVLNGSLGSYGFAYNEEAKGFSRDNRESVIAVEAFKWTIILLNLVS